MSVFRITATTTNHNYPGRRKVSCPPILYIAIGFGVLDSPLSPYYYSQHSLRGDSLVILSTVCPLTVSRWPELYKPFLYSAVARLLKVFGVDTERWFSSATLPWETINYPPRSGVYLVGQGILLEGRRTTGSKYSRFTDLYPKIHLHSRDILSVPFF